MNSCSREAARAVLSHVAPGGTQPGQTTLTIWPTAGANALTMSRGFLDKASSG